MTDLHMGLIGFGAVAVVGVFAYNKWQEYRHRKLARQVLEASHADVLLNAVEGEGGVAAESAAGQDATEDDPAMEEGLHFSADAATDGISSPARQERLEPMLRHEPELREPMVEVQPPAPAETRRMPDPAAPAAPVAAPVPSMSGVAAHDEEREDSDAPTFNAPRNIPEPVHLLSTKVDYIAAIEAVDPAPAYQILEAQQQGLARISKPIHWLGYNENSLEWEVIVGDGHSAYRDIRVGLQLADRQGPVTDMELSMFESAMRGLADELMAMAEMPARPATLRAASELDAFCASVDIQIGVNVIAQGQVFQGTKLRALAEAAGMVIDADGRFVRCDEEGNVLYVLLNQGERGFSGEAMKTMTTQGLTFLLDVPRVAHGERVFAQMVELARRFADTLRGTVVDDNRRPLPDSALEPIRKQIAQFQAAMAGHALPAGGAMARRLFS